MWAAQVQFEGFHRPLKLPPLNALSRMTFRRGLHGGLDLCASCIGLAVDG
jgi:hypothetical protein